MAKEKLFSKERKEYIELAKQTRMAWAKGDGIRDEGLVEPQNVRSIRNIAYTESDTKEEEGFHLLDLYYPEKECESYPLIVSVHGGGWFYGDKELYRFYCMSLAEKGFAVVNFNYRLSPEHPYPAGFFDVCYLMKFIEKHAKEYHLDLNNVFMVGDSCGAQLVSQYCIFAGNREYRNLYAKAKTFESETDMKFAAECPNKDFIIPNKVALNCGIYDMQENIDEELKISRWYLPDECDEELHKSFKNILSYMNDSFPNTYLMCSVNDALRIHTPAMKKKLSETGIKFTYREFGQNNKSDGHVFHINMKSENGRLCNAEELAFFKETI